MKQAIFVGSEQVGSLEMEKDGLFWKFHCKLEKNTERIHRIYAVKGWQAEYLGIPDATGRLIAKLPYSRLPEGIDSALATELPRGEWLPWRGSVEGIAVTDAFIRHVPNGMRLALSSQESLKFPAWAETMTAEQIYDTEFAVLPLSADGQLPMIEKEFGGIENEIHEEIAGDFIDPDLPDDDFADDDFGDGFGDFYGDDFGDEEQGWEADRADL